MSKHNKVRPVVKLYCLPKLKEDELRRLFGAIVATACLMLTHFGVKGEDDILVLFVPDSMKYGLGNEILVEIDLPMPPEVSSGQLLFLSRVATRFGQTVKGFFPKSSVQCTPYRFDPANSWTS